MKTDDLDWSLAVRSVTSVVGVVTRQTDLSRWNRAVSLVLVESRGAARELESNPYA
jgi:hypothetical protein